MNPMEVIFDGVTGYKDFFEIIVDMEIVSM